MTWDCCIAASDYHEVFGEHWRTWGVSVCQRTGRLLSREKAYNEVVPLPPETRKRYPCHGPWSMDDLLRAVGPARAWRSGFCCPPLSRVECNWALSSSSTFVSLLHFEIGIHQYKSDLLHLFTQTFFSLISFINFTQGFRPRLHIRAIEIIATQL